MAEFNHQPTIDQCRIEIDRLFSDKIEKKGENMMNSNKNLFYLKIPHKHTHTL